MSDIKQAMTLEDFVLLLPLLVNEIVSACTEGETPADISATSNRRQIDIANRLTDLAGGTDNPRYKMILSAMASAMMRTEPDEY